MGQSPVSSLPAVILAAGEGHRLIEHSGGLPKPLTPVLGMSLLERTVRSCREAGVTEMYVVIGYRAEQMRVAIAALAERYAVRLHAVEHPSWREGNGTSAAAVAPWLQGPFFLLMCDHVFDPTMLQCLRAVADGVERCFLAVDHRVDTIFDLPDATKVCLDGPRITAIGKELTPCDAIDTGLFLCHPRLFTALAQARATGDGSLSGGMRQLIAEDALYAVDIGGHFWSDVDTPESLVYTEHCLRGQDAYDAQEQAAYTHLQHADPVLAHVMARCGPYTLRPNAAQPFVTLCDAIVSQQLSGKVAAQMMARLQALYIERTLTPEAILDTADDTLRALGLSRAKVTYLKDLATQVANGTLVLADLPSQNDDAIIQALIQVKGIGRWTAEIFLIFALGRPDVFPMADLGIRKAIQRLYGYKQLPAPRTMQRHARPWRPYRTMASWYLWRSLAL